MTQPILVAGELMLDLLFVAADGPSGGLFVRAGGSAANVGRRLALGGGSRVVVIGKTGSDPNGAWLYRSLAGMGIDLPIQPAPDAVTGYLVLHRRRGGSDRVVYVERGANARLGPADRVDLDGVAWVHLSGYCLLEPEPAEVARGLAAAARRRGIPVSLDPGVEFHFRGRRLEELIRLFKLGLDQGPDLFLPSAGLVRLLGDGPHELGSHFAGVIVKDGAQGAWTEGEPVALTPPPRYPGADLSGAGDVFNAAVIRARLAGCSLREAAREANAEAAAYVESGVDGPGDDWTRVRRQAPPVLVSACLVGAGTAYDARSRAVPGPLADQAAAGPAERVFLPVCPEQAGGLKTPRPPAEIRGSNPDAGRGVIRGTATVTHRDGRDVTESFLRGARRTVDLARAVAATLAVLKDGSPSCAPNEVYDGTFTGGKLPGPGVTASALEELGVTVVDETAAGVVLGRSE